MGSQPQLLVIARESPARTGVAAATLVVAALGWIVTVRQTDSIGMAIGPGLGAFAPFLAFWTVMMAAMMLPSAVPMVSARPPAAPAVAAVYVLVWAAFGTTCYPILSVVPWHLPAWLGGIAIALAGVYSLTPLHRAFRDHCRELCWDGGLRNALPYAVNCVGCSAGLMIALLLLSLSNVAWMVTAAALVFVYKVVPLPRGVDAALGLATIAAGLLVAVRA